MGVFVDENVCNGCGIAEEPMCVRDCPGDLMILKENRKAVITFSDTAGAAKSAPTSKTDSVGEVPSKPRIQPPSEDRASTPRLVRPDDAASDIKARKSELMEQARKTDDPVKRERLVKEAIMLGNPQASRPKR